MRCFADWDKDIHSEPEQVKRRINGEKIKAADFLVNFDSATALCSGSGSEPYQVTLSQCSCVDFAMKGVPCKHMYRLATELGVIDPWPCGTVSGISAAKVMAGEDIEKWRRQFEAGNISPTQYAKLVDALKSK